VRWKELDVQQGAGCFDGNLKLRSQDREVMIQLRGEGQQIVALVRQCTNHRPDAMRTKRLAQAEFGNDEVEQIAARGVSVFSSSQSAIEKAASRASSALAACR